MSLTKISRFKVLGHVEDNLDLENNVLSQENLSKDYPKPLNVEASEIGTTIHHKKNDINDSKNNPSNLIHSQNGFVVFPELYESRKV